MSSPSPVPNAPFRCFRICSDHGATTYGVLSTGGCRLNFSRYNYPGVHVLYTAATANAAVLECLTHQIDETHRLIVSALPTGCPVNTDIHQLSDHDVRYLIQYVRYTVNNFVLAEAKVASVAGALDLRVLSEQLRLNVHGSLELPRHLKGKIVYSPNGQQIAAGETPGKVIVCPNVPAQAVGGDENYNFVAKIDGPLRPYNAFNNHGLKIRVHSTTRRTLNQLFQTLPGLNDRDKSDILTKAWRGVSV